MSQNVDWVTEDALATYAAEQEAERQATEEYWRRKCEQLSRLSFQEAAWNTISGFSYRFNGEEISGYDPGEDW